MNQAAGPPRAGGAGPDVKSVTDVLTQLPFWQKFVDDGKAEGLDVNSLLGVRNMSNLVCMFVCWLRELGIFLKKLLESTAMSRSVDFLENEA